MLPALKNNNINGSQKLKLCLIFQMKLNTLQNTMMILMNTAMFYYHEASINQCQKGDYFLKMNEDN